MQRLPGLTERRRAPRVRIRGRFPVSFLTTPIPIAVRNISQGGMLVESVEPFNVGSVHQLRMSVDGDDDGRSPVLYAACVYCHAEMLPDGSTSFLAGFTFNGTPNDEAQRQIFDLLDQATSMSEYQL
jgi:PilZ domain-containing protein